VRTLEDKLTELLLSWVAKDYPGLAPSVHLRSIEPPRPWGLASTVAHDIAQESVARSATLAVSGMSKKQAKAELNRLVQAESAAVAEKIVAGVAADALALPEIERVDAEAGYVNFYFRPAVVACAVLDEVSRRADDYGRGEPRGERVMVEFSQPNTHKSFHVGHLRNVAIGSAIAGLLEYDGYQVVRANYIGDIGLHVIKCLWALLKWPDAFGEKEISGRILGDYYSLAESKAAEAAAEGRAAEVEREWQQLFEKWEKGDPDLQRLWKQTRDISLADFQRIYCELGVRFDVVFYESEMERAGKDAVVELVQRGVATVPTEGEYAGAAVVDVDSLAGTKDEYGSLVILRQDGTSLYQTKELALAKVKFEKFGIDRSYYVVATEQSLYFRQVFKILELWGFKQAAHCIHIPYELVMLKEGKMSSREGNVVLYDDLKDEALLRLEAITREKGIAADVKDTARKIALAAIKFAMLNVDNNKVIIFDWDQVLNFNGMASPYIQYSYARARKLIEGLDVKTPPTSIDYQMGEAEVRLVEKVAAFPKTLRLAADTSRPFVVTRYLFDLCQAFTDFYHRHRVLDEPDPDIRSVRRFIVKSFSVVIESGYRILGLELPEEM
jgi:arginyl-tRNA synthetase